MLRIFGTTIRGRTKVAETRIALMAESTGSRASSLSVFKTPQLTLASSQVVAIFPIETLLRRVFSRGASTRVGCHIFGRKARAPLGYRPRADDSLDRQEFRLDQDRLVHLEAEFVVTRFHLGNLDDDLGVGLLHDDDGNIVFVGGEKDCHDAFLAQTDRKSTRLNSSHL